MKRPDLISENGLEPDIRRKVNETLRFLDSLKVLSTSDMEIDRTSKGTFLRPKGNGDSSANNQAPRWG